MKAVHSYVASFDAKCNVVRTLGLQRQNSCFTAAILCLSRKSRKMHQALWSPAIRPSGLRSWFLQNVSLNPRCSKGKHCSQVSLLYLILLLLNFVFKSGLIPSEYNHSTNYIVRTIFIKASTIYTQQQNGVCIYLFVYICMCMCQGSQRTLTGVGSFLSHESLGLGAGTSRQPSHQNQHKCFLQVRSSLLTLFPPPCPGCYFSLTTQFRFWVQLIRH